MSRPTFITIDLDALQFNFNRVKKIAPHRAIIAMVKANAYGHGIVRVAHALNQANAFGVASLEEGIKLREALITQPIVLMEGLFYPEELSESIRHQFHLVVHHFAHVEMLEKERINQTITIWLKINTGMNRLGVDPKDVELILTRLNAIPGIKKPIGLMTHFAAADLIEDAATYQQLAIFNQVTQGLIAPRSLANSAAILAWPQALGDWLRPGLVLYGASPFKDKIGLDHQLKPVMTLSSRIIGITKVRRGGKVGYGGTWTAPEDMSVGVVGVGYGDGYPQFAQNGTPVLVNGIECPLVGRVSMDMLTVDLRNIANVQIGSPVILWGQGLPVERVALSSHSSAYEILTRMTPRPKIEIKNENAKQMAEITNL